MAHLPVRIGSLSVALAVTSLAGPAQAQPASEAESVSARAVEPARYGIGIRMPRWVTVPDWLLGAFFAESEAVSTFGAYGFELIRRKADFDLVLGLSYQNMSPADGNWLGRGRDPGIDTDFVQFRGFGIIGVDASFVGRRRFGQYLGMRYGAGLGLALIRGKVLRTSSAMCTAANAGDERACRPIVCQPTGCTEAQLAATEGNVDGGPGDASRFAEPNVPGALPLINLSLGVDLRHPAIPGLEARLEGGFYNALFLGLAFNYIF
jgi:hypothetical protein